MEAFKEWYEKNKEFVEIYKDDLYTMLLFAFIAGEREQIRQRIEELKNGSN
jgi:hypothetical protein